MEKIYKACISIFSVSYILIGLVSLFAIVKGVGIWWGWSLIPSIIASLIITYIPFVGAFAAYSGMVDGWGWNNLTAFALVSFPYFIMLFGVTAGSIAKK